jgi:predicted Zn-dependent protease
MILSYAGQREKAIEMAHKAMRLNPHNPSWYVMQYGQILFDDRRHGEAVRALESVRGFGTMWIDLYLAASHMALGHSEAARSAITRALKRDPSASVEKWTIKERTPYKDPSDRERLRDYLRKAGLPEHRSID